MEFVSLCHVWKFRTVVSCPAFGGKHRQRCGNRNGAVYGQAKFALAVRNSQQFNSMNEGEIVSIIGPVVDVDFSGGRAAQDGTAAQDGKSSGLPKILNALRIPRKNF